MSNSFIERIARYIERHICLDKDKKHLVALSGGADSVALLRVMHELGYHVEAAHCNFHLRGVESDRDENFCKTLTSSMDIPLHIAHFDTKTYCSLHHVSVEMGARELRYAYFGRLMDDIGAETVCVAHHKDDCAETVLMNLVRGTGLNGMAGIKPRNGRICRPLLCVSRDEITAYLDTLGQRYVTDSSNLVADVKRNVIRLEVIPLLRKLNPSVTESIASSAANILGAIPLIDEALGMVRARIVEERTWGTRISIGRLMETASPEYILYGILRDYGFRPAMVKQIYENINGQTGRQWMSMEYIAAIDRGYIDIARRRDTFKEMTLPIEGCYVVDGDARIDIRAVEVEGNFRPETDPMVASLDASRVRFPLTLRRVMRDDRFIPLGMRGSKLVSDFLTDRKMSIIAKRRQLCLVDAGGDILWLVGHRIHERYKISGDTIKAIVVRYIQ